MAINNTIRRGQLILPFGIGAIVELPDETLITAGLDVWPYEYRDNPSVKEAIKTSTAIRDERLEKRLSKMLGRPIDKPIKYFLSPTEGKTFRAKSDKNQHMLFYRFPTWFHCPSCNVLKQYPLTKNDPPRCDNPIKYIAGSITDCSSLPEKKRPIMKPVGFLVACKHGHLDDFPWSRWVHGPDNNECNAGSGKLFLMSSASSGLQGVTVGCSVCRKTKTLIGANSSDNLVKHLPELKCSGSRPWLGPDAKNDDCSAESEPQLVLRSASSLYFPNTVSSILIPPYSNAINSYLNKKVNLWNQIENLTANTTVVNDELVLGEVLEGFLKFEAEKANFDAEIFIETVKAKITNSKSSFNAVDIDDEKFRFKEFKAFVTDRRPDEQDRVDFDMFPCDLDQYEDWVSEFFQRIVRVERLKETRAFTGFSRIQPLPPGEEKVRISIWDKDWIPAVEVRGEGIFLEFNMDKLKDWERKVVDLGSGNRLDQKIKKSIENGQPNFPKRRFVDNRFLLVHTFSHIFIRQLAFECGYDASSLNERLFVGKDDNEEMCGLLIYTASGDSEGSLGGLVERSKAGLIENTILAAVNEASFCSNDPICHETDSQGLEGYNVSACHSCVLLPETSCEHNNLLLDRRCIVGSFDNPDLGFFSSLLTHFNDD